MQPCSPTPSFKNGRYAVKKVLGTGTYGQVFCCSDLISGTDVAVKVAQRDAAYRRSALNEIEALCSLRESKDAVAILDYFEDNGHICIATELLDKDIYEMLRCRSFAPLKLEDVRRVALHVCGALSTLHKCGYMHCDIKPENIMLRRPLELWRPSAVLCRPQDRAVLSHFEAAAIGTPCDTNEDKKSAVKNIAAAGHHNRHYCHYQHQQFQHHNNNHHDGSSCQFGVSSSSSSSGSNSSSSNMLEEFGSSTTSSCSSGYSCRSSSSSGESSTDMPVTTEDNTDFDLTCLIDFGAVRQFHENTYYDVQSLWYRAPEVLCGLPYTDRIDSWSMGCVLFELYTGRPLFPGSNLQEQLNRIVKLLGYPSYKALMMGRNLKDLQVPPLSQPSQTLGTGMCDYVKARRQQGIQAASGNAAQLQCATKIHSTQQEQLHIRAGIVNSNECRTVSEEEEEQQLVDLIVALLNPDEEQRLSCTAALQHAFLTMSSSGTTRPDAHKQQRQSKKKARFYQVPPAPSVPKQQLQQQMVQQSYHQFPRPTLNSLSLHTIFTAGNSELSGEVCSPGSSLTTFYQSRCKVANMTDSPSSMGQSNVMCNSPANTFGFNNSLSMTQHTQSMMLAASLSCGTPSLNYMDVSPCFQAPPPLIQQQQPQQQQQPVLMKIGVPSTLGYSTAVAAAAASTASAAGSPFGSIVANGALGASMNGGNGINLIDRVNSVFENPHQHQYQQQHHHQMPSSPAIAHPVYFPVPIAQQQQQQQQQHPQQVPSIEAPGIVYMGSPNGRDHANMASIVLQPQQQQQQYGCEISSYAHSGTPTSNSLGGGMVYCYPTTQAMTMPHNFAMVVQP